MKEISREKRINEIFEEDKKQKSTLYDEKNEVSQVNINRVKELRNKLGIKSTSEFVEGIEGFSKFTLEAIEKGNCGLTLDKALKISQKYNVSLDYLYGLSNFMNYEEILINKAFEVVFDPSIIVDEYELKDIGKFKLELMTLKINEYLIKFLFDSYKLDVAFANEDINEYDYNYKMDELKTKLYEAIKNGGNLTTPYVLIPFDDVNDDINKIIDKYYKINNDKNKI